MGARRAGTAGTVFVEMTVDQRGKVVDSEIVRVVPLGSVDRVEAFALEIAAEWTFFPGTRGGRPEQRAIVIPVTLRGGADSAQMDEIPPGTVMEAASYVPLDVDELSTKPPPDLSSDGTGPEITDVALRKGFWPATRGLDLRHDVEISVGALVDTMGYVVDTWFLSTRSMEPLMQAALDIAPEWQFRPARKDGVPIKSKIIIPFEFQLH